MRGSSTFHENCVFNSVNKEEESSFLKIVYANLDTGIANKKDEISAIIQNTNPDVIMFNEILPKQRRRKKKLVQKDFVIDGYDYLISSTSEGRGVIIYFKLFLNVQIVNTLNSHVFEEAVWIRIKLRGTDTLLVGNIYRSPSSSRDNNLLLNNLLTKAVNLKDSHVLIVGDFNYGSLNWELLQTTESTDSSASIFIETIKDLFLYQHVEENTRHRAEQSPARLDLIFTNEPGMISDLDYLPPIGASDHSCLCFKFACYTELKPSDVPRPNFYKGDYKSMRETLSKVCWTTVENDHLEVFWNNFLKVVNDSINSHVPKVRPSNRAKKKPWLNKDALLAIQDKKRAWKSYKMCKTKQKYQKYAEVRNKATRTCRDAKVNFERQIASNIKSDSKSFWNYVRSQTKVKSSIGDLECSDGSITSSDIQKAELLNVFFASVFTNEDKSSIPTIEKKCSNVSISDVHITPAAVEKKLSALKTAKTPGIDCIHPLLLKECRHELCEIVARLFQQSLNYGQVPDMWRRAQVTPLFKKGNKQSCSNYRPVSLTVVLCKLLETFVRDVIMDHMEANHLFSQYQHGFRSKHSCISQLLEIVEHWSEILEDGGSIDCIYLDFAKAFDTVPHERLLYKLQAYGIEGKLLDWIRAFLTNRQQQVRVGSSLSSWAPVISGIPQGSVLGPTLFLVYINDLPDVVSNIVKLFADDSKVYRVISNPEDCSSLQEDLDSLQQWSEQWLLRFNVEKCKCMHLGKANPHHEYEMDNKVLEDCVQEKDLGVLFDNKLNFNEHIALKVKKANQAVGMIRNTFTCMDMDIFLPLYKSFVRPHLEYASVIWAPFYRKDILAIENVQRRATKMVTGLKELSYEDRLRKLGLPTLMYRRERADVLQMFKILRDYECVNLTNISISTNTNRGHPYKLTKSFSKTRAGQNRFSNRTVNNWNGLSCETVSADCINTFKSRLNTNWKCRDVKFSCQ